MNAGDGMLGAVWDGSGVRFRLRSQHASALRLCLFESRDSSLESERIEFARIEPDLWEAYVEGAEPGLRYGVRADGPWNPAEGHRFNPAKLLIDPYARAIDGPLRWHGVSWAGRPAGGPIRATVRRGGQGVRNIKTGGRNGRGPIRSSTSVTSRERRRRIRKWIGRCAELFSDWPVNR